MDRMREGQARQVHQVAVSAHRGGAEVAPGGSREAFRDAAASGAEYVEFDVQRTADGHLVAYHDSRAERRGRYPRMVTRAALEAESGSEVLGLTEVLALLGGRTKGHVDIKEPGYVKDIVGPAVEAFGPDRMVVTGEDDVVRAVKRHFPHVRAALSLGRGAHEIPLSRMVSTRWSELRPLSRVRACGADAVAVHHRLARLGVVDACERAGIGVMVWTVNAPAMIRSFLAGHRIETLITDRPRYALATRNTAFSQGRSGQIGV
jgi:glycerophosphoryl diester phosphodiesterase